MKTPVRRPNFLVVSMMAAAGALAGVGHSAARLFRGEPAKDPFEPRPARDGEGSSPTPLPSRTTFFRGPSLSQRKAARRRLNNAKTAILNYEGWCGISRDERRDVLRALLAEA